MLGEMMHQSELIVGLTEETKLPKLGRMKREYFAWAVLSEHLLLNPKFYIIKTGLLPPIPN